MDMVLPSPSLFQEIHFHTVVGVTKIVARVANQNYLTRWYRTTSPTRQELLRLRTACPPSKCALLKFSVLYTGNHKPFDLNSKITIGPPPIKCLPRDNYACPRRGDVSASDVLVSETTLRPTYSRSIGILF